MRKNYLIAAICAAPTILASLHITDGRRATCYPGLEDQMDAAKMIPCGAVQDGNVITWPRSRLCRRIRPRLPAGAQG